MKIDALDRKILALLDANSRQPASTIAKKCRVHKNVVSFRIKRLEENGILRNCVAMISASALGSTPYKFYFKLRNLTSERKSEIKSLIKKIPVYWSAWVSGRWDLIIGVLVRDAKELANIKSIIMQTIGEYIEEQSFCVVTAAPHYFRKYLLLGDTTEKDWLGMPEQKIDTIDAKILSLLSTDARMPAVTLASKVGITVKTLITRLRALEKRGVIYQYRISINLEKIGLRFFKCFITLNTTDKQQIRQLLTYCQIHPNIVHVIVCVGPWDLEPEFEIESIERFQEVLAEMRERFPIIRTVETIHIIEETAYTCVPHYDELKQTRA